MFYSKPYNLHSLSSCSKVRPFTRPMFTHFIKSEVGNPRYRSHSCTDLTDPDAYQLKD